MTLFTTEEARGRITAVAAAEAEAYERLLAVSPQSSIFCQPWYLDAVADGAWRLLTLGGDHGELEAAWPVVIEQRDDRPHVVVPPMTQKLGMILRPSGGGENYAEQLAGDHELIHRLLQELYKLCPDLASFNHSFHENFPSHLPFQEEGFEQTTRYTYLLHDLQDPDRLWQEMRPRARAAIRKARKAGLEIVSDIDFETFLTLNDLTFKRQGLTPPVPHDVLRRLDRACGERGCRRIFAARDRSGRLHAAVYIAWDNGTAYQLMLGSDPELRSANGPTLAIWHAIRFAAEVADTYDFEGSMMRRVEAARRDLGARQTPYSLIYRASPAPGPSRGAWGRVLSRLGLV